MAEPDSGTLKHHEQKTKDGTSLKLAALTATLQALYTLMKEKYEAPV